MVVAVVQALPVASCSFDSQYMEYIGIEVWLVIVYWIHNSIFVAVEAERVAEYKILVVAVAEQCIVLVVVAKKTKKKNYSPNQ